MPGQGAQVVLGRVGGTETQGTSDLRPGGRDARGTDVAFDQIQDLALAISQVGDHGADKGT